MGELRRGLVTIAELACQVQPSDPFHIVDETTYGLFDHARRVVEVISSGGQRQHLGNLVRRRLPYAPPDIAEGDLVFSPNITQPWGLVGPVVDWMRSHGIESDSSA